MKRINSIDGCNERDHELGFSIGLGTIEAYFGRDAPEAIFQDVMAEVHKAKLGDMYTVYNYALAMKRVIQAQPELYLKRVK